MSQKNSSKFANTNCMRHGNFDNDDLDAVSLIADRYKTESKFFLLWLCSMTRMIIFMIWLFGVQFCGFFIKECEEVLIYVVSNTLTALQEFCSNFENSFSNSSYWLTGSNGKTIVRVAQFFIGFQITISFVVQKL
jgi:hypothetical protein